MAERRNVRILLRRGAGIVARAGSGNSGHRRDRAHALSAKRIRYHDAGLAARRPAARSHRHHTARHAIHEKAGRDGRRSDHDRLNLRQRRASVGGLPEKGARALRRHAARPSGATRRFLDPMNALFKDDWLIHDDVPEDMIEQVTVGVDPSGGGDEVGIVASALLNDGRFAVLADRTTTGSPAQWGEAAVKCHDDFDADDVVVEVNFGGDMATEVVKQAAERAHQRGERGSNLIRVKEVSASRGKAMRAEPISLLYEKARVLHRRGLDQLESEMMAFSREWDRTVDGSPNRLDAMIWGITRLSKIITHIPIA